ncbi:MAG TPA: DUF417 family protein [Puia sp.]
MKNFTGSLEERVSVDNPEKSIGSGLIRLTKWMDDYNIGLIIIRLSIIMMLFWAGAYKLTAPGAEGIVPLVTNSPLISWLHKILGTYGGSDFIGITEIVAASLILTGSFLPEAGMVGSLIAIIMFFVTSTMIITTPDSIIKVKGIGYMTFTGLFLFKDLVSLGSSFYLLSHFRQKAQHLKS